MASLNPISGTLGLERAGHLLRRTTYCATRQNIELFAQKSVAEAVEALLTPQPLSIPEPIDPLTGQPWINSGVAPLSGTGQLLQYVRVWWLHQARLDCSIGHKMEFFLHATFVTNPPGSQHANFFDYLALLRYYAVGSFRKLAEKMTLDNVMLTYLDNALNTAANPNENYAREFLELFTIGKGAQAGPGDYTTYTEYDVQQAARVLTGFRNGNRTLFIDPETGIPCGRATPSLHDKNDKTFSAAFQNATITGGTNEAEMFAELSQFIDMVFAQPATALFICRKLYRYFVSRNITAEIETDIIVPLAETMRTNNYELKPVLSQLFNSAHFYDEDDTKTGDEIIGGLMKSPLELILGTFNHFNLKVPDPFTEADAHYRLFYGSSVLNVMLLMAGMDLFRPADVAGYPAYYQEPDYARAWFNSNSIVARYKLPEMLLTGQKILAGGTLGGNVKLDIVDFVKNAGVITNPFIGSELVSDFLRFMFPKFPTAERFDYFYQAIFLDNSMTEDDWSYEWLQYTQTGITTEVRVPLENLFKAILYSPEYQLQ